MLPKLFCRCSCGHSSGQEQLDRSLLEKFPYRGYRPSPCLFILSASWNVTLLMEIALLCYVGLRIRSMPGWWWNRKCRQPESYLLRTQGSLIRSLPPPAPPVTQDENQCLFLLSKLTPTPNWQSHLILATQYPSHHHMHKSGKIHFQINKQQ